MEWYGNELADQEAYKAASSTNTQTLNLSTLTDLKKLIKNILYKKMAKLQDKTKKK